MPKSAMFLAAAAVAAALLAPAPGGAAEYRRDGAILGGRKAYGVKAGESLYEIAKRFDLGYTEIASANPRVDPFIPEPGRTILLPSEWILPEVPFRKGIVINLAEMRLFLFPADDAPIVTTFPVGIGDQGMDTPVGIFSIVEKIRNPAWYVPESIRREKPELPAVVPPGPDNPMGSRALRLSLNTILIHGTDRPWGIGTRSSHGCIRLYEEDIARLFGMVGRGARVTIVRQPVKVAVERGRVFLEVHKYDSAADLYGEALRLLGKKGVADRVDPEKVRKIVKGRRGLVVDVSK